MHQPGVHEGGPAAEVIVTYGIPNDSGATPADIVATISRALAAITEPS